MPIPEDLGKNEIRKSKKVYIGGESHALEHFKRRLTIEAEAFMNGSFLPNRRNPVSAKLRKMCRYFSFLYTFRSYFVRPRV